MPRRACVCSADGIARRSRRRHFNGLHLRLEADAAAWIEMFGGLHKLWRRYLTAAKTAHFDRRTPLVCFQISALCREDITLPVPAFAKSVLQMSLHWHSDT